MSQFRLENYKMYEWFSSCRERFVENIIARKWDGYFARELATLLYTRAGRLGGKREILWKKKPQFYGKESPLMLYFKMNQ